MHAGTVTHGVDARPRFAAGTRADPANPRHSACAASARPKRWTISATDMQRKRLRRHASQLNNGIPAAFSACSGILAVPYFEVEQRPQQFFVVLPTVHMIGNDAVKGPSIKIGAR